LNVWDLPYDLWRLFSAAADQLQKGDGGGE
jgi:hypothetical protein